MIEPRWPLVQKLEQEDTTVSTHVTINKDREHRDTKIRLFV
jgi:hypothetical protein